MSGPQLLQFSFAGGGPWRALDVNGDADGMPIAGVICSKFGA
jgi:hypothetical protein